MVESSNSSGQRIGNSHLMYGLDRNSKLYHKLLVHMNTLIHKLYGRPFT